MAIGTAIAIGSAIYGGGKALGLWGQPPKQKYKQSTEEIAYFKELERRSREGVYGQSGQFNIYNRLTSAVGGAEQRRKLASKGEALFAGKRGVASREAQKVGTESMYRALVEGSLDISEKQEMSKFKAQERLGELGLEKSRRESDIAYSNAMAQYGSQQAGMGQMFAGLGDIASSLATPQSQTILGKAFDKVKAGQPLTSDDEAGIFQMFIRLPEGKQEEFAERLSGARLFINGINQ